MSREAPWIALAIDWQDSEMLEGVCDSVRLAWVCLLCFAKAQGRAGRVCVRVNGFAKKYSLDGEAVRRMLELAASAGSIAVEGDVITILNWKLYQDPRSRSVSDAEQRSESKPKTKTRKNKPQIVQKRRFSKTSENDATIHHTTIPPSTDHRSPREGARPTLAEVQAYCRERGNSVDPQKWFDHYESNGWLVGKNRMKDWKAAVRTWERNTFGQPRKQELPSEQEDRDWTP